MTTPNLNIQPVTVPPEPPQPIKPQSKLIRTVLQPALGLWLRSQTESLGSLEVEIEGSDRQLISGQIPALRVVASQVVYQGLHLSRLRLVGDEIRMNLGQAVRGKPLRLLEPIRVRAELLLRSEDLNASLGAAQLVPSLAPSLEAGLAALADWLQQAGPAEVRQASIQAPQIEFLGQTLRLQAQWREVERPAQGLAIAAQLTLDPNQNVLSLTQPHWLEPPPSHLCANLGDLPLLRLDLGKDVVFESLAIEPEGLSCRGIITIHP